MATPASSEHEDEFTEFAIIEPSGQLLELRLRTWIGPSAAAR
jgi:hypothetical protein